MRASGAPLLPAGLALQGAAVWSWANYLEASAAEQGRPVLAINLDESSVPAVVTHALGNVPRAARGRHAAAGAPEAALPEPTQPVRKGADRQNFTLVATICSESWLQPLMPQVLLGKCKLLSARAWLALQEDLPDNVYVKHNATGWNSEAILVQIVTILGFILRPFLELFQPVLFMDAAPFHLAAEVLSAIAAAGLWFVCIPARFTWLLQPLDTHVFLRLKRKLRRDAVDDESAGDGEEPLAKMMRYTVHAASRGVLQAHQWRSAFEQNGLLGGQGELSRYVREQISATEVLPLPARRPDAAALRACWPRGRAISDTVWRTMPPAPAALPAAPALAALAPPAAPQEETPESMEEESAASAADSAHDSDFTPMMLADFHGGGDYSASAAGSGWEPPAAAAAAAPPRFRRRSKTSGALG